MAERPGEESVYQAAKASLKKWLSRTRDAVMAPWREFKAQPNPSSVYSTAPLWQMEVDRILVELTPALREGWAAADLPRDFNINDPFIQANLALTKNLLVRIPDEVHAKIVAAILEGANRGEDNAAVANRIDDILTFTGSENWDHRAKVIAQTELTRHRNSSAMAHALLVERMDQRTFTKKWHTTLDGNERSEHKDANGQVQTLRNHFRVGGEPLSFPGDPKASADNICGCRCDLSFEDVGS